MEKEYKHKFAGVSSNDDRKFEDEFIEVFRDSGQIVAVSKKTQRVGLGSKNIDLRLVVNIEDWYRYSDKSNFIATLAFVPVFKHLHKDRRKNFLESVGLDITEKEYADDLMYYFDAVNEGTEIYLCQEEREYTKDNYDTVLENMKADIANTTGGYYGLVGFYLDKAVNRIGMNGWDYLRQYCNDVKMSTIIKELKRRYA